MEKGKTSIYRAGTQKRQMPILREVEMGVFTLTERGQKMNTKGGKNGRKHGLAQ